MDAPNRNEIENEKDEIAVGTGDLEGIEGRRAYMIDYHGVVVADLLVGVSRRVDGRERRSAQSAVTILRKVY